MYVERDVLREFERAKSIYNAVALVGVRQAGKTTFLKEKAKGLNSSYILFDDPDARALFDEDIKRFDRQYVEGYEVAILDEVGYCKDAGSKLKYLVDIGRKLWLTSSSEVLLEEKVLSYLVGRVSVLRLYPFSLPELLAARGQKELTPSILQRLVWEHMMYGGFPKIVLTEEIEAKRMILRDLQETMLLKDVARTFGIQNLPPLESLVRYLAVSAGEILNYEKVCREVGISFPTLKKYLDALEKSYLIRRVRPFTRNPRKEMSKRPKIYFIDTGLRNLVAKVFQEDGKTFENYIFTELLKAGQDPRYWRTKGGAEVDFVVETDTGPVPIEVKLEARVGEVGAGLRSFIENYRCGKALVITYKGESGEAERGGCKIIYSDPLSFRYHLKSPLNISECL